MSRFYSYLNSAKQILLLYKGEEPFSSFLKKYFAANKKFGSKDRKSISHLCYCYFRLGKAESDLPTEDRILSGLYLCSQEKSEILDALKSAWNDKIELALIEKLSIVNRSLLIEDVFPWKKELSDGIVYDEFCKSFLIQPDLFLRLRPGKEKIVIDKLNNARVTFNQVDSSCLALPNASHIDNIIELNKEAVIQDYSSQRVGEFFEDIKSRIPNLKLHVWDCCAASGGKSIMIKDILGDINLTVSDIRESIIANLKKRFKEAGIANFISIVSDLTNTDFRLPISDFDLIICDAPCTGSGTWSRTPEQLFYFDTKKIDEYADRQRKIVSSVIPHLKPGGYLLYITCSVFKNENEEVVEFISKKGLKCEKMEVLKGYDKKADTMYAALLKKPL